MEVGNIFVFFSRIFFYNFPSRAVTFDDFYRFSYSFFSEKSQIGTIRRTETAIQEQPAVIMMAGPNLDASVASSTPSGMTDGVEVNTML